MAGRRALLGVDVGGTFTDGVLVVGGRAYFAKAPSRPGREEEAIEAVIDRLLAAAGASGRCIARFAHGMTVTTNALLEGRTAKAAFLATAGFTDVVDLGRQARPSLYRLCDQPPRALVPPALRFAVRERITPEGVEMAPQEEELAELAERVAAAQPEAVAVALLHSYANPVHERLVARALRRRLPGLPISLSSELVGTFREYERWATTELDAALSPLLDAYLRRLGRRLRRRGVGAVEVVASSGGLLSSSFAARHGAHTVLSGPAGGVAAAKLLARRLGEPNLLCIDMGGTSCDISLIEGGEARESPLRTVAGRPIALPSLEIVTIGAGGGSIAWRDRGGALRVGPRSAGANPGPACYGRGGSEPTVTDANLLLGKLAADQPLAGGIALDREAAERAIGKLANSLRISPLACAEGIAAVAEAEMARALRVVTIERGIDPRRFALLAFGGAAGLHACLLAEQLGIERVVIPQGAGVLSALGLAASPPRRDRSKTVLLRGRQLSSARVRRLRAALERAATKDLGERPSRVQTTYELRFAGQSFELPLRFAGEPDAEQLKRAFKRLHRRRYGFLLEREIELVTIRVAVFGRAPRLTLQAAKETRPPAAKAHRVRHGGRWLRAALYQGELPAGTAMRGPAVLALAEATVFLPPGWQGKVLEDGTVALRRGRQGRSAGRPRRASLPIELSLLLGSLRAACEEMGATLIRSACSPNIKERRDASTALFDRDGELIMQAEHIPVHLGAMPDAVAAVRDLPQRPGRSWILNDPYRGGTHLPDITVVTPCFHRGRLIGFAAARAHHADVGGSRPGSMPADSTTLAEEGVVIPPSPLTPALASRLAAAMRSPQERLADLRAQLASCELGAARLAELVSAVGPRRFAGQLAELQRYSERRMVAALERLRERCGEQVWAEDCLEGPEGEIRLQLQGRFTADQLVLDFSGSAPQQPSNLNCPLSVTRSAAYFAVRATADPTVPACAGANRPIVVRAPRGSILNATPPAAVAAGNVETSSRVADLVLAAFGRALGQGTMNNLTLGNERFAYYETIGGGQGACPDGDGPSGVHVAMSNTMNTPIEALEQEHPLLVRRYALRSGSGGRGRFRGGDGVVREIEAREEVQFSLIAERRKLPPRGAAGGGDGKPGRDFKIEASGRRRRLAAKAVGRLLPGERLLIETPGGGGYGSANEKAKER